MNRKLSFGDKILHAFIVCIMLAVIVITLYPFWYVLVASFSDAEKLNLARGIILLPQGVSLQAYQVIFQDTLIWKSYGNTILYTVAGTLLNIVLTTIGAYELSRRQLIGKSVIMKLLVFTMYFNGGLIPTFLLMDNLGLIDNRLVMILPNAISVYNLIILRTAFLSVPHALEEAAIIDGASPIRILVNVILPLTLPSIMVIGLFYMVGHWNSYFNAMIYLRDSDKYPLQLVLRNLLIENNMEETMGSFSFIDQRIAETVKYAAIIVSVIPVFVVYPFVQKFFVQGAMIGSIKE